MLRVLLLLALAAGPARAAQPPAAPQRFAELGDFPLQNGGVIRGLRLGYRTLGKLNADKSNAVLWPTWLDGRTGDQLSYVGPGRWVDSSKYFVILVDALGNGVTSSPSNSKAQPLMAFPKFSVRDMVESQYRLVTKVLGIKRLHAVIGTSLGGIQAFEWSLAHPDAMDAVLPMFGTPRMTSYDKLMRTAVLDALQLDPAWNGGRPTGAPLRGLALAAELGAMSDTTPAYRVARTPTGDFRAFLADVRQGSRGGIGKAADHIRQRQAGLAFDLPAEYGLTLEQAAKRVRAKMLVVVAAQDHAVNPAPALAFAAAGGFPTAVIESDCGHMSVHCVALGPVISSFLDDPGAARSVVLRDQPAR